MQAASNLPQPTLQGALATLPLATPFLLSVTQAASEMPGVKPVSLPQTMDAIGAQFANWRETNINLLEPLLGLAPDQSLPCVMAAVLASAPSPMPFHNHHHTREVVMLAMMLSQKLPLQARVELFVAACIHDFVHDGMGNMRGGKHTPMRLERKSLDAALPYLVAAGLSEEIFRRVMAMVLSTDVSKPDKNSISPAEWMRKAYAGESGAGCPEPLQPLFADKSLAHQAALLEDSDLGTSAGLPYKFAQRMTALIAEETRVLAPTPQTLIGFIDHICHGAFITPEAKALFGENMQTLRAEAEAEATDTIYKWS